MASLGCATVDYYIGSYFNSAGKKPRYLVTGFEQNLWNQEIACSILMQVISIFFIFLSKFGVAGEAGACAHVFMISTSENREIFPKR